MIEITAKQRKYLEKCAQPMNPLVQIGGAGLTEEQIKRLKTELADQIESKEVYLNLADKDTDQFMVKADSKKAEEEN